MPEPKLQDDDGDEDVESDDAPDEEEADVSMVETDVSETGADPDGFFDGVETDSESGDDVARDIFDDVESGSSPSSGDSPASSTSSRSSGLADDINSGVARAAVIGLDEVWETEDGETRKKDDLEDEFRETFEAFRLGHYAGICAEEYLLADAEDINPVWGLIGAALICSAVIVYKRPDGDQIVDSAKMKLGQNGMSSLADRLGSDDDEDNG